MNVSIPSIHKTDMYHINASNKSGNGFVTGDYYYAQDWNRLYKAASSSSVTLLNGIYVVISDTDRLFNIPKISGMYYYCVEKNQLWQFSVENKWEFTAGDYDTASFSSRGFYDGTIVFTKEAYSSINGITTFLQKVNNMVFGHIQKVDSTVSVSVFASVDADFLPETAVNFVVQKDKSTSYNATINVDNGQLSLSDSVTIQSLDKNCKFWYSLK